MKNDTQIQQEVLAELEGDEALPRFHRRPGASRRRQTRRPHL